MIDRTSDDMRPRMHPDDLKRVERIIDAIRKIEEAFGDAAAACI